MIVELKRRGDSPVWINPDEIIDLDVAYNDNAKPDGTVIKTRENAMTYSKAMKVWSELAVTEDIPSPSYPDYCTVVDGTPREVMEIINDQIKEVYGK